MGWIGRSRLRHGSRRGGGAGASSPSLLCPRLFYGSHFGLRREQRGLFGNRGEQERAHAEHGSTRGIQGQGGRV